MAHPHVQALLDVDCVLFDFDGPVCRLFARHPATGIATRLKRLLRDSGEASLLTGELRHTDDPHALLVAVHRAGADSTTVARLEEHITREETEAAESGVPPTPHLRELLDAVVATGRGVAVTTNNSALAAEKYLGAHGLLTHLSGHVHGRRADPGLMKPHPDCLTRALASTGSTAGRAVLIGDTPSDHLAAKNAGVGFIGYAMNESMRKQLADAGAAWIIDSLEEFVASLTGRSPTASAEECAVP